MVIVAASNGQLEVVKWLVTSKHSSVEERNHNANTPLHRAAWNGYLEVAKWLVKEVLSQRYASLLSIIFSTFFRRMLRLKLEISTEIRLSFWQSAMDTSK